MMTKATCELCGEPMPAGEEMFKFHGYSGPCPKPPLSEKSIQTSDDEFTATDFRHVAQLLRSTDDKVVRASLSNWINAIIAALDFAAKFEPKLTAAKANEIYASQLMLKFRSTLSNIVDGCDDEGDRIYFGSTNAADQLREISEEIEELEWGRILASSQKKPDRSAHFIRSPPQGRRFKRGRERR